MTEAKNAFTDGEAYDHFMGRWSRAVGPQLLDWLALPTATRGPGVGCGTGVFTQLIIDQCAPPP